MARATLLLLVVALVALTMIVPSVHASPVPTDSGVSDAVDSRSVGGYHTYAEVEAELRQTAAAHPNIAAFMDLGELFTNDDGSPKVTWEGNHLWALKISDNPNINESDEPKLLYMGEHHAREWITVEVVMYTIDRIVSQYGNNASITSLVNSRELWFVPMVNPDGLIYTQEHQWGVVDMNSMWRKNFRDNGDGTFGVDINRNYGFDWAYDNVGSSPITSDETYRGPAPFSEPETQLIRDLGTTIRFSGAITFHSFAQVIFFPWGHKSEHAPDYLLMKELGRRMAVYNGYQYGDLKDGLMYAVNGECAEWFYANTSCLAFTIEVGTQFIPDESQILPICQENYEPEILLARYAPAPYTMFQSGISGVVQDPRGNPIEGASVHVELLGKATLNFTTGPDGAFSFRAPRDDSYHVTVRKDGYSTDSETVTPMWQDRLTSMNFTIRDMIPPVIVRVVASFQGKANTSFGIGQDVRIDVFEKNNETGLQGTVTVQSIGGQYFHRKKPLTFDAGRRSYYYVWNTSGLKPRDDYQVYTELWDIDNNKGSGIVMGQADLVLDLRDITPPMAPHNVTVETPPEGGSLRVRWAANIDDTEAYTLQRRVAPSGEWKTLINLTKRDTQFIDQGLQNGVRYEYRLMAWDAVPLPSPWSAIASGVPTDTLPPGLVKGILVAAPPEGGELDISWQESTDDTATYVILRDAGDMFVELSRVPRGTTSYNDTGLQNQKTYQYKLRALDLSLNAGPLSDAVIGMPRDVVPPDMPTVDKLPELTNALDLRVGGRGEPGSTVDVQVNGQIVTGEAGLRVGDDGNWSGTVTLVPKENRIRFRARDMAGNPSGMTTEVLVTADITPPSIDYQNPVPNQVAVEATSIVEVKVSEALVPSSVSARLVYADSGGTVPSSFTYDEQSYTIKVFPAAPLDKGTAYQVVLVGTDRAGNALTGGTFSFTTIEPKAKASPVSTALLGVVLVAVVVVVLLALLLVRRRKATPARDVTRSAAVTTAYSAPQPQGQGQGQGGPGSDAQRKGPTGDGWEEY